MTTQSKGKVERSIRVVRESFWPGVHFTDLDDLNRQAQVWLERLNTTVHRSTHRRPADLLAAEGLRPLVPRTNLRRLLQEERKVIGTATSRMTASMACRRRQGWPAAPSRWSSCRAARGVAR